jgi:hypothetical protein
VRKGASKGVRNTFPALPDCTPVDEPLGLVVIMPVVPVPGVGAAVPVMPLMSFWGCTLKLIPGVPAREVPRKLFPPLLSPWQGAGGALRQPGFNRNSADGSGPPHVLARSS